MVRAAFWLVVSLVLLFFTEARAQYQGYLPVQTGGCEQASVTVPSNGWGTYTFRQQDLDTVLVGGPNPREMQVVDTTCYAFYDYAASRPYWWVTSPYISLIELKQDGTFRWRLEAQACNVTTTTGPFRDYIWLVNRRSSLDIFRDPPLQIVQSVYVVAVPPPQP